MVNLVDKRLRQEKYALWQAKRLHRQLLGDAPWIPCGAVEKPQDRAIFEPAFLLPKGLQPATNSPQESTIVPDSYSPMLPHPTQRPSPLHSQAAIREPFGVPSALGEGVVGGDTEMTDTAADLSTKVDVQMEDVNSLRAVIADSIASEQEGLQSNSEQGPDQANLKSENEQRLAPDNKVEKPAEDTAGEQDETQPQANTKPEMGAENDLDGDTMADDGSPEPPRRMTTRAQANQVAQPNDAGQPTSPVNHDEVINGLEVEEFDLTPHPLYQFPSIRIDRNCGLPPIEAEETRHLLWAYIQKQGETVRLFADILEMLRKAYRMKENVFEWCKAEGHIGEMSDGEDWYDREKWLPEGEDLKKGADEEEVEVDEGRAGGKRGRRRA